MAKFRKAGTMTCKVFSEQDARRIKAQMELAGETVTLTPPSGDEKRWIVFGTTKKAAMPTEGV